MNFSRIRRIAVAAFSVAIVSAPVFAQQGNNKENVQAEVLTFCLQNGHYSPIGLNDTLSQRAFTLFMKRLDYGKMFLLRSDFDRLKEFEFKIDDEIQQKSNRFRLISGDMMLERTKQAQAFVKEILDKPFDFTTDETLQTDPEKRDYAKNLDELRDLWRKTLKYQALQRYVELVENRDNDKEAKEKKSDAELEAEARKSVLKNNNERFDRLLKETDADRVARYLNSIALAYEAHTEYFAPKEKENFDIQMSGTLEGIGATLRESDGFIKVESLVPGGPAWKQKELQAGDAILKAATGNGEATDLTDMRMEDAVRFIRGKKGTEARLTIKKANGDIKTISIIRDVIVVEETFAKSAIISTEKGGKKFGYIFLPKFYADFNKVGGRLCGDDVRAELEKLKSDGVSGIILDFRNNGGGSLEEAVKMGGLFIKDGPIVQVRAKGAKPNILSDTDPSVVYDGPVIVLVNQFSASASEIVAAALQDYGRAVIVGAPHTFGKGTVQTFMELDNYLNQQFALFKPLGSLKITFQKFYRVTGHSTQFKGVTPDIVLPDSYEYIPTGEKQLDYPLPWDVIEPSTFTAWNKKVNIAQIREKSAKRTAENKGFQLIEEQAKMMQKRRDDTAEELNIVKMRKERDENKAESKKFDDMPQPLANAEISVPVADSTSDEDKKRKQDEWFKQLQKDLTLSESISILKDIIGK